METINYFKCKGCMCRRDENEFEVVKGLRRLTCLLCKAKREKNKCEHNRVKTLCKDCGGSGICEHKKQKSACKDCGGSQICEHNRVKSSCKDCGGSEICEHSRQKSKCKDCGGVGICEHGRRKSRCKDCGGSEICEHSRQKSSCKDCGGSQICEHNRHKSSCKDCGGSGICEHNRHKSSCKDCGGSQICEHNRHKSSCKDCGGSKICEHNREKPSCKECSPQLVVVKLVRNQVRRVFKNSTLSKINHSISYLGCDTETLKKHIQAKMIEGMTFDNIHYDHIKPVSRFDLNDEEELLKCCHFTNLQPLFAVDNMEKKNKWTAENEVYWNEFIIYKPDFCVIYN